MMRDVSRALIIVALIACRAGEPAGKPAEIIDLSTSFEELRRDFEAHRDEPRFLTLLAPT